MHNARLISEDAWVAYYQGLLTNLFQGRVYIVSLKGASDDCFPERHLAVDFWSVLLKGGESRF